MPPTQIGEYVFQDFQPLLQRKHKKKRFVYIKSGNLTPDTLYRRSETKLWTRPERNPKGFVYMLYMLNVTQKEPIKQKDFLRLFFKPPITFQYFLWKISEKYIRWNFLISTIPDMYMIEKPFEF